MREQARGRKARAAIVAYLRRQGAHGREPTVREIAKEIGLSVAATHRHLVILMARGEVRKV